MKEIAKLWLGDASVPGTLYPQYKPAIQVTCHIMSHAFFPLMLEKLLSDLLHCIHLYLLNDILSSVLCFWQICCRIQSQI